MRRGDFVLSFALVSLVAACGGGDNTPDANLQPIIDASPPDASPPDAFVCTLTDCGGGVCVDTTSDPGYCGDCTTACPTGGQCVASTCECPPSFIPLTLGGNPTGQDMVLDQLPGTYVAITPYFGNEIDAFGVGYDQAGIALDTDFTLDGSTLPATPFAIALFNIDIATMMPESGWAAVSGTINFSAACADGASGTITDAVFQAASIFPTPMVDPNGCTFDVPLVNFSIGAACP